MGVAPHPEVRTPSDVQRASGELQHKANVQNSRAEAAAARSAADLVAACDMLRGNIAPRLEAVAERARALGKSINPTADAAARLRGRVEMLHEEHTRVQEAIRWCETAAMLKRSLASLAAAIERADWTSAAEHCANANAADIAIRNSVFAAHVVPTTMLPAAPPEALESLRTQLISVLVTEFERATSPETADEQRAMQFLSLFAPVNGYEEGLAAYAAFAATRVHGVGKEVQQRLSTSPPNAIYYGTLLGAVFEQLAVFIDKHQPIVDELFGAPAHPGFADSVLPRLRDEWSALGMQVVNTWRTQRGIRRLQVQTDAHTFAALESVRAVPYEQGQLSRGPREAAPAPDVDAILDEFALMASQWSLFRRFLHKRLGVPPQGDLDETMAQLLHNDYVALESFFLRASIDKAHALDTLDAESKPLMTSLCDDLFFMLRASLTRTLSTSSLDAVEAVIEKVIPMLERDLVEIVVLRMDACRRSLDVQRLVDGPRKLAAIREVRSVMTVYLNVLDTAANYTERIIEDTAESALLEQYFDPGEEDEFDSELSRAQELIRRLGTLTHKLRSAVHFEMEELFSAIIAPRLDSLKEALVENYRLDEPAYALANENDALPKRFASSWNAAMGSLGENLTSANYSLIFGMAVDSIVSRWEDVALSQRYTELGALRFDKDVRAIIAHLTEHSPWSVRDRFSRLQQIAYALNADDEENGDVYALGVAVGISWQFTPDEVQSIRKMRL
ncbi:Golgi transport complex subunit 4 [Malassezia cuniculi]|uniref:Conserved oligomeric Golgi complex subunit 4 n=1 Tax=Malassezia cuniculi TaxID=948313 RepID=A0AAF0J9S3_9BASI|nr:Golgi transport complex subunit 4 [Malassezia cuniculi]